MSDPYTQTAKMIDAASAPAPKSTPAPSPAPSAPAPAMRIVGKKYMDPQSRADEEYMEGAQRKINQGLMRSAEKMSREYRSRRYNDRRFGRRSGR